MSKRLYRAEVNTDEESVNGLLRELHSTITHAQDQGVDSLEVIVLEVIVRE